MYMMLDGEKVRRHRTRTVRQHSAPPIALTGTHRPDLCLPVVARPFKVPFPHPPPHLAHPPRLFETPLGFRCLPVYNALSSEQMTFVPGTASATQGHRGAPAFLNVDITHTVEDVECSLRALFARPQVSLVEPRPADLNTPIRSALTNETTGLRILLPTVERPPRKAPPPPLPRRQAECEQN